MSNPKEELSIRQPETPQEYFERVFGRSNAGTYERPNDDGSETTIRRYELVIDPMNDKERRALLSQFLYSATRAGYTEAMSPLVIPNVGFKDPEGRRPLTAVNFFLEEPRGQHPANESGEPTGTEPPLRSSHDLWHDRS